MYRTQQKKRSEPSMGAKPSAQEVEAEDRRPEARWTTLLSSRPA